VAPVIRSRPTRLSLVAAVAAACFLGGGPAALAHVQVQPTAVAPTDSVMFTVIVPGETGEPTTKVELQLPPNLLPFAFEDPPGWKRKIVPGDDPLSLGNVVWTGHLAPDGFAQFRFLAGTPEEEGELVWKTIQTYADGTVVRWVGGPDAEEPAAITQVTEDAPRQNAGGESAGGEATGGGTDTGETETTPTETETTETPAETEPTDTMDDTETTAAPATGGSDDGDDWLARFLALIAVAVGFAAIAFSLGRSKGREES
jgi:uncharacterized protein YcnI